MAPCNGKPAKLDLEASSSLAGIANDETNSMKHRLETESKLLMDTNGSEDECSTQALAILLAGLPLAAQAAFAAASGAVIAASVSKLSTNAAKSRIFAAVRGATSVEYVGQADNASKDSIGKLDEVLQSFAPVIQSVTVTNAKEWLRAVGESKVASRLSRLSKMRNNQAHPDSLLLMDVTKVIATHHDDNERQHT